MKHQIPELRSAWTSAQLFDQSLCWPHEEWRGFGSSVPLSAQRRLWSDKAYAQAALSLLWAHMSLCCFFRWSHYPVSKVRQKTYSVSDRTEPTCTHCLLSLGANVDNAVRNTNGMLSGYRSCQGMTLLKRDNPIPYHLYYYHHCYHYYYFLFLMYISYVIIGALFVTNEPPRDKTNKVSVHPTKTQISLGIVAAQSHSSLRCPDEEGLDP